MAMEKFLNRLHGREREAIDLSSAILLNSIVSFLHTLGCVETVPCMEQLIVEWFVFALKCMFGFGLGQNVYSGKVF